MAIKQDSKVCHLIVLDGLFSVTVVGSLVVLVWRGAFLILDLIMFPGENYWSAYGSVVRKKQARKQAAARSNRLLTSIKDNKLLLRYWVTRRRCWFSLFKLLWLRSVQKQLVSGAFSSWIFIRRSLMSVPWIRGAASGTSTTSTYFQVILQLNSIKKWTRHPIY